MNASAPAPDGVPPGHRRRALGVRARRTSLGLALGTALVLTVTVVWTQASAAFTGATSPVTTTVSTGTVAVSDDDAGTALFTVSGLRPGASATRCIAVTSTGSAPSVVRLYGTNRSTHALAGALTLTVTIGTGGGTTTCSGFRPLSQAYRGTLAAFPVSGFGSGVGAWTTAGGAETRTYHITYSLAADAPTTAQNRTATLGLTWEARNR